MQNLQNQARSVCSAEYLLSTHGTGYVHRGQKVVVAVGKRVQEGADGTETAVGHHVRSKSHHLPVERSGISQLVWNPASSKGGPLLSSLRKGLGP